jgi:hypothetical protein
MSDQSLDELNEKGNHLQTPSLPAWVAYEQNVQKLDDIPIKGTVGMAFSIYYLQHILRLIFFFSTPVNWNTIILFKAVESIKW